jgi:hypothetical protein
MTAPPDPTGPDPWAASHRPGHEAPPGQEAYPPQQTHPAQQAYRSSPAHPPQQAYPPQSASSAPGVLQEPRKGWLRRRAWLCLTVPPLGFTTWAAFLYIGIRARRPQWLAWAAAYAGMLVSGWILSASPSSTADGVATALGGLAWIGGGVHAIAISGNAVRRIGYRSDPALEAARLRVKNRAQGRKLLAAQPLLAREVGVGRPDVPGSDHYDLVDVNHAAEWTLRTLPGITDAAARKIVQTRAEAGGFSSAEDLGLMLGLPPGVVDELREVAVFLP